MPKTITDTELLRRYASGGDEAAFRTLSERHAGLVYNTALRCTSDPELAGDVCQSVFLLLSLKASRIDAADGLAGWLHRTAVFHARNASRKEVRRRRALQALENDMSPTHDTGPDSLHPALPFLDQALDRLPGRDREVIMGHFYYGHTYQEIARQRDESEAAVQRRASRAVEKLSCSLRRAGLSVPVVALTGGLSAVLQTPAPACVLATPLTLAGPCKAPAASLLAKSAALLAAGGLSGAAAYAVSAHQPARVSRAPVESAANTLAAAADRVKPVIPPTGPRGDWQVAAAKAADCLRGLRTAVAAARAAWILRALTMDELTLALHWAKALPDQDIGAMLGSVILNLRARENPAAAWDELCLHFDREHGHREPTLVKSGERIFRLLWEKNPADCLARLPSLGKTLHLEEGAGNSFSLIGRSPEGRAGLRDGIARSASDDVKVTGAQMLLRANHPREVFPAEDVSWLMMLPFDDPAQRVQALRQLIFGLSDDDFAAGFTRWLEKIPLDVAPSWRAELEATFLGAPEEDRLQLSKSITDPALRRAIQESL